MKHALRLLTLQYNGTAQATHRYEIIDQMLKQQLGDETQAFYEDTSQWCCRSVWGERWWNGVNSSGLVSSMRIHIH